ncbi:hypothetical protein LAWI1_G008803 [Lachnellula willkommii]|uniref:Uncharacterized protein n=1 Tax=Lachnellula willkommii TaxID=215461 RepID=A0A559M6L7_9HELO|nr:hypothetical protein LAWI1_G008803 [Lachnellula willkommii]
MSVAETIKIAHTARCKLQLAADRPDRNLRFILGHAFTLDNVRLRIAEIEEEEEEEAEDDTIAEPTPAEQRRVSFSGKTKQHNSGAEGRRSPPPPPQLEDDLEEDDDEDLEEDDEEDEGLGLQRFGSAAAQPPRIAGEESSGSDEDEEGTNLSIFSEDQLKTITNGPGNEELKDAYKKVHKCPCHGKNGPAVERFWDVPAAEETPGLRMAVVQISAE